MDKLIPAFKKSILDSNITDSVIDLIDGQIDTVITEGIINQIPVAKLLLGVGKTAQNIQERNAIIQVANFIKAFNSGDISKDKIEKYKAKLNENSKYAEKELGRVLIVLNSTVETKKSKIIGCLFNAYVNEDINWIEFCDYLDITSQLFVSDLPLLIEISNGKCIDTTQCDLIRVLRLERFGLAITSPKSIHVDHSGDYFIKISDFGKGYCNILDKSDQFDEP